MDAVRDSKMVDCAVDRPVRILWQYLRQKRGLLVGLFSLELVAHSAALIQPMVARWVLGRLEQRGSLLWPVLLLAVVIAVGMVLSGVCTFLLGRTGQLLVRDLRIGMARRLLGARVSAVERCSVGDVLSRLGSDTTLLRETIGGALVRIAASPVALLAAMVFMAVIDLPMLGIVVALLALGALAEKYALRKVEAAATAQQAHLAAMTSTLQRALIAFRTVKASGAERHEERMATEDADGAYRAGVRAAAAEAVVEVVAVASVDVMFLVVLAVGASRVASGTLTLADVVAFLLYVVFLREPVEALSYAATEISEGLAAVRRIEQTRGLPVETDDQPADNDGTADDVVVGAEDSAVRRAEQPRDGNGVVSGITTTPAADVAASLPVVPGVRFEEVRFGYHDQPVLRDVTFEAGRGLTVLVGSSGAGKTTVLSLIERFSDVDAGRVLLDGCDVRILDRGELRRRLAYVQQEAPILGETVREAALYGVPEAELADLDKALHAVALDTWVAKLPDGLDTAVGERGIALSGGQRQRLALARALLRDADVLLLDEATSQLDPVSERTLLDSLAHEARSRVVLAVTHRLSVAVEADQVIVLEKGKVHAAGRHQDLMRSDAFYRELVTGRTPARKRSLLAPTGG